MKIKHYCLIALMLPTLLAAQVRSPDISEKYSYAVVDTLYGDYFGLITLRRKVILIRAILQ